MERQNFHLRLNREGREQTDADPLPPYTPRQRPSLIGAAMKWGFNGVAGALIALSTPFSIMLALFVLYRTLWYVLVPHVCNIPGSSMLPICYPDPGYNHELVNFKHMILDSYQTRLQKIQQISAESAALPVLLEDSETYLLYLL